MVIPFIAMCYFCNMFNQSLWLSETQAHEKSVPKRLDTHHTDLCFRKKRPALRNTAESNFLGIAGGVVCCELQSVSIFCARTPCMEKTCKIIINTTSRFFHHFSGGRKWFLWGRGTTERPPPKNIRNVCPPPPGRTPCKTDSHK